MITPTVITTVEHLALRPPAHRVEVEGLLDEPVEVFNQHNATRTTVVAFRATAPLRPAGGNRVNFFSVSVELMSGLPDSEPIHGNDDVAQLEADLRAAVAAFVNNR